MPINSYYRPARRPPGEWKNAGLEFRATKDLDIVLHIEALECGISGEVFWKFVEQGGYEIRQAKRHG